MDKSIDKSFVVQFESTNRTFNNLRFAKINNSLKPAFHPSKDGDDIYYDEIVDYDGGDVDGYGDN